MNKRERGTGPLELLDLIKKKKAISEAVSV